ncbi:MAG: hypothetical protein ABIH38_04835 [Patescibacteria group bacterium]
MNISKLQKYILITVYSNRGQKISRKGFERFYNSSKKKPKKDDIQNIITKSSERLIDKELLIGYGRRTPHKWFIDEISLTGKGKKTARKCFGEQQTLPFKKRKK